MHMLGGFLMSHAVGVAKNLFRIGEILHFAFAPFRMTVRSSPYLYVVPPYWGVNNSKSLSTYRRELYLDLVWVG